MERRFLNRPRCVGTSRRLEQSARGIPGQRKGVLTTKAPRHQGAAPRPRTMTLWHRRPACDSVRGAQDHLDPGEMAIRSGAVGVEIDGDFVQAGVPRQETKPMRTWAFSISGAAEKTTFVDIFGARGFREKNHQGSKTPDLRVAGRRKGDLTTKAPRHQGGRFRGPGLGACGTGFEPVIGFGRAAPVRSCRGGDKVEGTSRRDRWRFRTGRGREAGDKTQRKWAFWVSEPVGKP